MARSVRLAFDIGGTFTDIVLDLDGRMVSTKVLTTPDAPERGALEGIAAVLAEAGVTPPELTLLVHGTTLATNAIIERKGAKTALVTTAGFRDSLEMAYENRFEQYDMYIEKPAPLVPRRLRFTVQERLNARGQPLVPLDEAAVAALAAPLREAGIEAVAVGFLHSYANDAHERRAAALLAEALPGVRITLSSEVCPEIREYERLSTAVANAYVQPLMASYLVALERALGAFGVACPMFLMTSGGGLTTFETAARFPIRLVESGPAGGAILAASLAGELGLGRILSFDMGGTTAKICLIDEAAPQKSRFFEVDRRYRFVKGSGLPVRIPVIEMVEIGAGGGSIAAVDATRRIVVGPDSAGAAPGPACYGRGGTEPTVTDADVVLGRIAADGFAGGRLTLDATAAAAAIGRSVGTPLGLDVATAAYGVAEIVEENMASAARVHAVERGKSLEGRVMIAFGGAAPLHAARVAEKLGIDTVLVPASAGVGSAVGFLRAPIAFEGVRSLYLRLSAFDAGAVNAAVEALVAEATAEVRRGAPDAPLIATLTADMRYRGQGHEVVVPLPLEPFEPGHAPTLRAAFEARYAALYGRTIPGLDIEVLTWTVSVSTPVVPVVPATEAGPAIDARSVGTRPIHDPATERFVGVPLYDRAALAPGARVTGPSVIAEAQTTTIVTRGFDAAVDRAGHLRLTRKER
ncbi:hydantoinase/oxoprolinase family protein [Prosthecomicrobium pneumaticum]|uniref:N-methylhydantoinase A n=1 Tax=Prosthecomicrobium pneumaticum TaxID=81895 RepID=A0A7W9CTJ1_9HYPH|nr:hydantoinase/oxoprolinase family protein [Prosthecomicrobium pneumaticum]MBB5751625.1 N-methylhydantoinase A [Prosthecomicrobium pneumaticum]